MQALALRILFFFTKVVLLNGVLLSPACFLLCKAACCPIAFLHHVPHLQVIIWWPISKDGIVSCFKTESFTHSYIYCKWCSSSDSDRLTHKSKTPSERYKTVTNKPIKPTKSYSLLMRNSHQCSSLNYKAGKINKIKTKECELDNH